MESVELGDASWHVMTEFLAHAARMNCEFAE